jgi:hypothetical protein
MGLPTDGRPVVGLIAVAFGTLRAAPFVSCLRTGLLGFLSKASPLAATELVAFDDAVRSIRFRNGLGRSSSSSGVHSAGALTVRCIPFKRGAKCLVALDSSAWVPKSSADGDGFQVGRWFSVLTLAEERLFVFAWGVLSCACELCVLDVEDGEDGTDEAFGGEFSFSSSCPSKLFINVEWKVGGNCGFRSRTLIRSILFDGDSVKS